MNDNIWQEEKKHMVRLTVSIEVKNSFGISLVAIRIDRPSNKSLTFLPLSIGPMY